MTKPLFWWFEFGYAFERPNESLKEKLTCNPFCRYLFSSVLIIPTYLVFKLLLMRVNDIDSAFNFANRFNFCKFAIEIGQAREEIHELSKMIDSELKTVLEIGTYQGGTLLLWSRLASPLATIISVDLPLAYNNWRIPFYRSLSRGKQDIQLIRGDSQSRITLEKVKQVLDGRPLDFLFIDGSHRYEDVKHDFETYSPLVQRGGIVAFHDIAYEPDPGVIKLWDEIKQNFRYAEIGNIGVLFV